MFQCGQMFCFFFTTSTECRIQHYFPCKRCHSPIYYNIDVSVSLENNQWHIFHILIGDDIDNVIYRFLHWVYIKIRKLHGGLKIWILSSRGENNIYSFASLIRKILKIHHSTIKSISSRHRVISSIYCMCHNPRLIPLWPCCTVD